MFQNLTSDPATSSHKRQGPFPPLLRGTHRLVLQRFLRSPWTLYSTILPLYTRRTRTHAAAAVSNILKTVPLYSLEKASGISSGRHSYQSVPVYTSLNRILLDSFRCAKCHKLVECYSNLLLLRDGSPICEDCSYVCHACGKAIKAEAIMTGKTRNIVGQRSWQADTSFPGDEAYHAECFRCAQCNIKIEDLVFTQTSKVSN